jgi:hypothetical protein
LFKGRVREGLRNKLENFLNSCRKKINNLEIMILFLS